MLLATKPQFLIAPWPAPSAIKTLITTNHADFNLASHVNDDPHQVAARRASLRDYLPATPLWLQQVHGCEVINADTLSPDLVTHDSLIQGDASISCQAQQVLAIMTADCLPILLTDTQANFVAAIHAGWRGLNNGIIYNTLDKLQHYPRCNILAFIGPAIGEECFEIDQSVKDAFLANDSQLAPFFKPSLNTNKFLVSLRQIAFQQLCNSGLRASNITNPEICTKCMPHWFYSYRAKPNCGRITCFIWKS